MALQQEAFPGKVETFPQGNATTIESQASMDLPSRPRCWPRWCRRRAAGFLLTLEGDQRALHPHIEFAQQSFWVIEIDFKPATSLNFGLGRETCEDGAWALQVGHQAP